MAKRRPTEIKLARIEARVRLLRTLNQLAFTALCLALAFLVVATAVPQRRNLIALEDNLAQTRSLEQEALAEKEFRAIEHQALRLDPAFLELHARDRLDYHRPGERILKIRRSP
jgi:hypothetical protein